ncbi:MAG TPA: hypothetical protein VEI29_02255, partial [Burkholderiaceae bacterium]|nr:hypothetical protein [Burkholderiaceae bacterium]
MRFFGVANARVRATASFLVAALGPLGWIGVSALILAATLLTVVLPSIDRLNAQQSQEVQAL